MVEEVYDIMLIGGGPVGLFGMFYAGVRDMKAKIIDYLPELGGQLTALYPEKYIFDIMGFPKVIARDFVAQCAEQALQFGGKTVLGERVETLRHRDDGLVEMSTQKGMHYSRTVVITAGVGAFAPNKLPLPEVEKYEDRGIIYHVGNKADLKDKRVLVVGGGNSAVDWCLNLQDTAREITMVHRRDKFRAHEGSVQQLLASPTNVMLWHEVGAIHGHDRVEGVTVFDNRTKEQTTLPVDVILMTLGFKASLGPIKDWGLVIESGSICVNQFMETNLPGVYAAGDIATFPGKLKLIATGAADVTIAVCHAKHYIDPSVSIFPGHSSNRMGG